MLPLAREGTVSHRLPRGLPTHNHGLQAGVNVRCEWVEDVLVGVQVHQHVANNPLDHFTAGGEALRATLAASAQVVEPRHRGAIFELEARLLRQELCCLLSGQLCRAVDRGHAAPGRRRGRAPGRCDTGADARASLPPA